MSSYLIIYERSIKKNVSEIRSPKRLAFIELVQEIDEDLGAEKGSMSDLRDCCNGKIDIQNTIPFNNREMRVLLTEHFGSSICFTVPKEKSKSSLVFLEKFSKEDMAEVIRSNNPEKQCGQTIRQLLLNEDFGLQDRFCDEHELKEAWKK